VKNDWNAHGMRGTGSHTIVLQKVFVPETAIVLRRPRGEFHPFWNVVLTAAMPLIMSVYVGLAEKAAKIAITHAKTDSQVVYLLGEMQNELTTAQVMWKDMLRINNNLDFQAINAHGNDILIRKTIVANACIKTVAKAVEVVGGRGYLRSLELERLLRDVQAAPFHPLPEKAQHAFTGNYLMENKDLLENSIK
jgi:alkylation response protein AidB-like acyl-CoA dehydrogenase